jgi:transposase
VESKFTPENRAALILRTAAGVPLSEACKALDLRPKTVKAWLRRGRREGGGPYAQFFEAIERAREVHDEAVGRNPAMDEAELKELVSEAARSGSVHAMTLLWEMIRAASDDHHEKDDVDDLSARRAARLARRATAAR